MTYTLKRSKRAKALRIAVYPGGDVVVVAPERTGLAAIERFVAQHSGWAARTAARLSRHRVIEIPRADIPRLKREAARFAEERAAHYARRYGVTIGNITIRAQRSRWGSCSRRGDLSFNYKIAALPRQLAEYVIVHEVCHRLAFDHSARFWAAVAQEVPAHKELRRELRRIAFRSR